MHVSFSSDSSFVIFPVDCWHLVYQASVTHEQVPISILLRVNLEYMAIVSWTALGVSLSIACGRYQHASRCWRWTLYADGFNRRLSFRLARDLVRTYGEAAAWRSSPQRTRQHRHPIAARLVLVARCFGDCYLVLGQLIFGWMMLAVAWPALADLDLVRFCAVYTLAWFIGFISILAPGGIGIRELAFASMAPRASRWRRSRCCY